MTQISKYHLLFIVLISSVVFLGLGSSSLLDYDEGIYAQVSREMLQNNEWLTLTLGEELWFEKPPLFMWSTALWFKLFGVSEFWARVTSAISSVLVILLTYIIGSKVFDTRVGLLSIFPLLSGYEFMRQARNGTTDMMLTLFIILILAVYVTYPRKNPGFWYLISILFSLGFMVKFWAVFIVIMAIGIDLIIEAQVRETFSSKHFWGAIGMALLLILPWHLVMYFKHGQEFIDRYFFYDLIRRTMSPLEGNTGSPRYYFDRMAYDFSPWFLLLPIALTVEIRRLVGSWNRTGTLILFTGCIFGVYSLFVGTKIFHYLTPIYPMLAIFCASVLIKAYDNHQSSAFSGLLIAVLVATIIPSTKTMMVFLLLSGFIVVALFTTNRLTPHIRKFFEPRNPEGPKLVEKISNSSRFLLSYLETLFEGRGYTKLVVLLMYLFLFSVGIIRTRNLYQATESPLEKIAHIAGASDILYDETLLGLALPPDYVDGIAGPAAMFYSERPIEVAWNETELSELTANGPREIIMGERDLVTLSDKYEFSVLVKSPPFIYSVIRQREEP